jgi:hypothetical protein
MMSGDSAIREQFRQLYEFLDSIRYLASLDMVGRPFGAGFGLEAALELASMHIESSSNLRMCGSTMAIDFLTSDGLGDDDLDKVMGLTDSVLDDLGISPELRTPLLRLGGAAKVFLGQFDEPGQPMWDLWCRRDDVAAEFLCWLAVARLRLATVGRMEQLDSTPPI